MRAREEAEARAREEAARERDEARERAAAEAAAEVAAVEAAVAAVAAAEAQEAAAAEAAVAAAEAAEAVEALKKKPPLSHSIGILLFVRVGVYGRFVNGTASATRAPYVHKALSHPLRTS